MVEESNVEASPDPEGTDVDLDRISIWPNMFEPIFIIEFNGVHIIKFSYRLLTRKICSLDSSLLCVLFYIYESLEFNMVVTKLTAMLL